MHCLYLGLSGSGFITDPCSLFLLFPLDLGGLFRGDIGRGTDQQLVYFGSVSTSYMVLLLTSLTARTWSFKLMLALEIFQQQLECIVVRMNHY